MSKAIQPVSARQRPLRILALYHRASTFGGSFNSVSDVLTRTDKTRFTIIAGVPGAGNCARRFGDAGLEVVFVTEHAGSRTIQFALHVAGTAMRLRRWAIDLVYVTDYVTWRSSALTAARVLGIPRVIHVRAPLAPEPIDPELLRATVVVGNSRATIRALEGRRPTDGLRVVYNFIDVERFAGARDIRSTLFAGRPPVVGFVGVFRPEKGIEYFLEMAQIIHAQRPDVRFLMVGGESTVEDVGWFPRMRQYAETLGLGNVVRFTGSRDDVPDLMRSIDVLVVPSLNEGFGRVIVEANAAGVGAIGADAAGIPEVIEHGVTGFLVPPRDAQAMATATVQVLDNPELRARWARDLPAHVRTKFSPDVQINLLQQIWDDALSGRM